MKTRVLIISNNNTSGRFFVHETYLISFNFGEIKRSNKNDGEEAVFDD